jgi:hypothetical protein
VPDILWRFAAAALRITIHVASPDATDPVIMVYPPEVGKFEPCTLIVLLSSLVSGFCHWSKHGFME